jgi:hypothetical protein
MRDAGLPCASPFEVAVGLPLHFLCLIGGSSLQSALKRSGISSANC